MSGGKSRQAAGKGITIRSDILTGKSLFVETRPNDGRGMKYVSREKARTIVGDSGLPKKKK